MLKKILTGALSVAALALTFSLAAPQPAEARIVCREGWHGQHCFRVHRVRHVPYHRVHYVPHHRWHQHGYYYGHYYR